MAENEPLRKALEHYLLQKREKLKEVQEIDLMISRLKRDLGEAAQEAQTGTEEDSSDTGISDAWQENEFASSLSTSKNGAKANVRPDEFFGMTYSTAAAAYLERVGYAVSMDELLDALSKGGCPVGGKEPRKTLYISLIRAVKTFVPIPGKSGYLGLRRFYPNLKAARAEKEEKQPRRKRREKLKAKGATVKGLTAAQPKRRISPEGRKRIADAQKARWDKFRKAAS